MKFCARWTTNQSALEPAEYFERLKICHTLHSRRNKSLGRISTLPLTVRRTFHVSSRTSLLWMSGRAWLDNKSMTELGSLMLKKSLLIMGVDCVCQSVTQNLEWTAGSDIWQSSDLQDHIILWYPSGEKVATTTIVLLGRIEHSYLSKSSCCL